VRHRLHDNTGYAAGGGGDVTTGQLGIKS
jgi:hypothetical protein